MQGIWLSWRWLNYRTILPLSTHCPFHLPEHLALSRKAHGLTHFTDGKAEAKILEKVPPLYTVEAELWWQSL